MNLRLALLGFTLLLSGAAGAVNLAAPIMPDPLRTPGDVLTSDAAVICRPGYTKTVRNVPQALKEQVYRDYGIRSRETGEYEVDHLISLELGGSNSVRNLWPESFKTQPLNAHVKDDIENRLHDLACAGTITFPQAQQAIAANWEAAYVRYLGPLPGGAQPARNPKHASLPVTHVPTLPRGSVTPAEAPTLNLPILPGLPTPVEPSVQRPPAADRSAPEGANPGAPGAPASLPPTADGGCPDAAPVKVSRAGLFHVPGDPNYAATRAVACYQDAQAASAAGHRAPGGH